MKTLDLHDVRHSKVEEKLIKFMVFKDNYFKQIKN